MKDTSYLNHFTITSLNDGHVGERVISVKSRTRYTQNQEFLKHLRAIVGVALLP